MKKIMRVSPASAGKVGGVLFLIVGFLAGVGMCIASVINYSASMTVGETIMALVMLLVFAPFIAAFWGIVFGLLGAWFFNITVRFTGGLMVELVDA